MNKIPGYDRTEKIHEGSNSIIFKGTRDSDNLSVVIKTPARLHPHPREIARIRHEYNIIRDLDRAGIIRVHDLIPFENTVAMVIEDFGGRSLKHIQGTRPLPLQSFLKIAIPITEAIGQIHAAHIIHKDIKPQNVIVNTETGELKIIDFGIASLLSRENPRIDNATLGGTLAYISPEQTGRMSRFVDYRSDFYSLGIMFYEMLTGRLPFPTKDPMELIHSHIARMPPEPHVINSEVPRQISRIIFRLLAKTAEERYQSALGLRMDLEECLNQLRQTKTVADFDLGASDVSGLFQIPQKLYGRETEITSLTQAFDAISVGSSMMVLLSGTPGIGKSALVQTIQKPLVKHRGYFISGKFDQFNRDVPYHALINAFQELMRQILTENESAIQSWKRGLNEALGAGGRVITEIIPEVELIIGEQPEVPELPPREAENRFHLIFKKFLQVFARKEHPLVLFLDDLQWADSGTIKLIQTLLEDGDIGHLLVLGAYRSNEVDEGSQLMLSVHELQKAGVRIQDIGIGPLGKDSVRDLLHDTVRGDQARLGSLTDMVLEKTGGNPFFLNEYLTALYNQKLLNFNSEVGRWEWDPERIEATAITANVVELVSANIQKLPAETQDMLKIASCLGGGFDLKTLSIVSESSVPEAATALEAALEERIIVSHGDNYLYSDAAVDEDGFNVSYKFAHDRIQEAAYELNTAERQKELHLNIGRYLLKSLSPEKRAEEEINIVSHFNQCLDLIQTPGERHEIAGLNLNSGLKARSSGAYREALNFLTIGSDLLPADAFESDYELALVLWRNRAETEYLNGMYAEADRHFEEIITRATSVLDKAAVYEARCQLYFSMNNMDGSIAAGIEGLGLLGVQVDREPGDLAVLREIIKARYNQGRRSTPGLIDLPELEDPRRLMQLRLLSALSSAAYATSSNLLPLLALKMLNLSLRFGNSPVAAFAYASYGLILCAVLGFTDAGYAMGELSLKLIDRYGAGNNMRPRVYYLFGEFINSWKHPVRDKYRFIKESYRTGLESGDLVYVAFSIATFIGSPLWSGDTSLEELLEDAARYDGVLRQTQEDLVINTVNLYRQLIYNLQGKAPNKFRLTGDLYDEDKFLEHYTEQNNPTVLFFIHLARLCLLYILGQHEAALVESNRALPHLQAALGQVEFYVFNFFHSLTLAATATGDRRGKHLKKIKANQGQMKKWAATNPANFESKFLIIEGERARLSGKPEAAGKFYERAIQAARKSSFLMDEAVATELAAKLDLASDRRELAEFYMTRSVSAWHRWGADQKVQDLHEEYGDIFDLSGRRGGTMAGTLFEGTIAPSFTVYEDSTGGSSSGGTTMSDSLDLASVVRASQALSGEIMLSRLLDNMMDILVKSAGAEKGVLLLNKDGSLLIEALKTADETETRLPGSIPFEDSDLLSPAVVHYTVRTGENLVLGDAAREGDFQSDEYVLANGVKSLLCSPITNQGQLIGILYLENNLTAGAFTADRLDLLKILSSQAAISIQNSRLYEKQREALETQTKMSEAFARFVPMEFLRFLGKESIMDVTLGDAVEEEMTVLFSDIRSFTSLSEKMTPRESFNFINGYLGEVGPLIREHNGFIDKYIGDAIMALFPENVEDAVAASIQMQKRVVQINSSRGSEDRPLIRIGVGIHTGNLMLGTIGETQRMEGTVIADAVNLASRMEGLTKTYGAAIIISGPSLFKLKQLETMQYRFLGALRVKGKAQPVSTFEILDGLPDREIELKLSTQNVFEEGIHTFLQGQFGGARKLFAEILNKHPEDSAIQHYLQRSEYFEQNPTAWQEGAEEAGGFDL